MNEPLNFEKKLTNNPSSLFKNVTRAVFELQVDDGMVNEGVIVLMEGDDKDYDFSYDELVILASVRRDEFAKLLLEIIDTELNLRMNEVA